MQLLSAVTLVILCLAGGQLALGQPAEQHQPASHHADEVEKAILTATSHGAPDEAPMTVAEMDKLDSTGALAFRAPDAADMAPTGAAAGTVPPAPVPSEEYAASDEHALWDHPRRLVWRHAVHHAQVARALANQAHRAADHAAAHVQTLQNVKPPSALLRLGGVSESLCAPEAVKALREAVKRFARQAQAAEAAAAEKLRVASLGTIAAQSSKDLSHLQSALDNAAVAERAEQEAARITAAVTQAKAAARVARDRAERARRASELASRHLEHFEQAKARAVAAARAAVPALAARAQELEKQAQVAEEDARSTAASYAAVQEAHVVAENQELRDENARLLADLQRLEWVRTNHSGVLAEIEALHHRIADLKGLSAKLEAQHEAELRRRTAQARAHAQVTHAAVAAAAAELVSVRQHRRAQVAMDELQVAQQRAVAASAGEEQVDDMTVQVLQRHAQEEDSALRQAEDSLQRALMQAQLQLATNDLTPVPPEHQATYQALAEAARRAEEEAQQKHRALEEAQRAVSELQERLRLHDEEVTREARKALATGPAPVAAPATGPAPAATAVAAACAEADSECPVAAAAATATAPAAIVPAITAATAAPAPAATAAPAPAPAATSIQGEVVGYTEPEVIAEPEVAAEPVPVHEDAATAATAAAEEVSASTGAEEAPIALETAIQLAPAEDEEPLVVEPEVVDELPVAATATAAATVTAATATATATATAATAAPEALPSFESATVSHSMEATSVAQDVAASEAAVVLAPGTPDANAGVALLQLQATRKQSRGAMLRGPASA